MTSEIATASKSSRTALDRAKEIVRKSDAYGGTALLALVIIGVLFTILTPDFLTQSNMLNVGRQAAVLAIVACGMTLVIISANIDLSVGSIVALCLVVGASVSKDVGFNGAATAIAMIALGAIIGAVNGSLVAWVGVNAFIVTLGMMTVLRGTALTFTGGYPISGISDGARWLGFGNIGPIPVAIVVAIIIFAVTAFLLNKTVLGRHTYAVGGNELASTFAGVPVARTKFAVFVISGAFCGLAATVLLGRLGAGLPTASIGLELDAIAAVIIGGASLFGGRGSVFGTLFGVLILTVLQNGLNLVGVSSFVIQILSGVIIVLAVLLDRFRVGRA